MKRFVVHTLICVAFFLQLNAAVIQNGGSYTNAFVVRPAAADWSTRAIGSGAAAPADFTTPAALDAAVQTNAFSRITNQLPSANGSPPVNSLTALWSTNGYLQTRPNANAATLLMATFFNDTLTNATIVRIAYDYQTNRAPLVAEEIRGLRVYYSVTGAENSWSNVSALSHTAQGRLSVDLELSGTWAPGSNLYLLWADDNGSGSPDDANNIDNFFLTIVDGVPDFSRVPPVLGEANPPQGEVTDFQSLTLTFSEPVTGVEAGDLLINNVSATLVNSSDPRVYTFSFTQPALGPVDITWTVPHGIFDLDSPPKPFDGPANSLQYIRVDPAAPIISARIPLAGATVSSLTNVSVSFSEPVTGVDAIDFLVNGIPAANVSGSSANYSFYFTQPAYGAVNIGWAMNTGIQNSQGKPFDGLRTVNRWSYTLVDQTPPTVISQDPAGGSFVPNLTQITVTFSEPVSGVNAADLLVSGTPATAVTGSSATYTFTIPQINGSMVFVSWVTNHGIVDLAVPSNAFSVNSPGARWSYLIPDGIAPSATIYPPPGATVRNLTRITVTFDEVVIGVDAADLLINNVPAGGVTGRREGPYVFTFTRPATGEVQVAFASEHAIQDMASNPFPGGTWNYTLNPALQADIAVRHVVQISLDGLGAKYLEHYLQVAPDQFPNFVRLANEAAFTLNARCDHDISETVPNHATMFMGRPVYQPEGYANTVHHGYDNNFPTATDTFHNYGNLNVPYKSSMFDVAHDYGRTTAFYAGKTRLAVCERSYNEANGALDLIAEGGDNGRDKIDVASVLDISGAAISNEVNTVLSDLTNSTPKNYTFIHIAEPDLTGHSQNWGTPNWSNAVRMVDSQLGRIINAIDTNPVLLNQTALIVTADHGGGGVARNGHTEAYHITNYTIPFFLRAPGIPGGADLYDLFSNRSDPGTNRTDYTTQPQPIRNGDGSNLALALLALPPIPGSFMVPGFATSHPILRMARFGGQVALFWYDPHDEYDLQAAGNIAAAQWDTIDSGITSNDATKVFTITDTSLTPMHYFRLRQR
jgi:hypothetical protein